MTRNEHAIAVAGTPADRFRQVDEALWASYGLAPRARIVRIDRPHARLRVVEVGSGPPVLLIHGTVGPGAWPSLIAALAPARFLVLERPGWGDSEPLTMAGHDYRTVAADLLRGTLDALGIERATAVGGSIGDVWALSLADRHPNRVERVVLLGAGPLVREVAAPRFIKLLASPLGALIVRLPMSADRTRSILRNSGHGPSLHDGRIPDAFVQWRVSLSNDTNAMRHERAMVRSIAGRPGWSPGPVFTDAELRQIGVPTRLILGSADPVGDVDLWRRVMGLMPHGNLALLDGAGHMPWFDQPDRVAALVDEFVAGAG